MSVVTPEGPGSVWRLSRPRAQRVDGDFEVSADLDGSPIWFRSADAELVPTPEAFAEAARMAAGATSPNTDVRGSADYKRHVAEVFVRRGLEQALARAQGGDR